MNLDVAAIAVKRYYVNLIDHKMLVQIKLPQVFFFLKCYPSNTTNTQRNKILWWNITKQNTAIHSTVDKNYMLLKIQKVLKNSLSYLLIYIVSFSFVTLRMTGVKFKQVTIFGNY